jgi:predicted dithiol-disulfide oxidoreductase (DUF899 family)
MSIEFPGESADYRQARNRLLEAELSLRAEMERVSSLRRHLPRLSASGNAYQQDCCGEDAEGRGTFFPSLAYQE